MAEQTTQQEKRTAPETGCTINSLIAACNQHDRFNLLEDDSVLPADLDNFIHPIFSTFEVDGFMKQTLQLASQFLMHDSLLMFFVPLVYGREFTETISGHRRAYLSDPTVNVSRARRLQYVKGVREALHCLSHSTNFSFVPPIKRVYARTILSDLRPAHASTCCPQFQKKYSCKIEITDKFRRYYSEGEYAAASRCAQFRHDFLFATTLVHEIVHAVGILRRGNLCEPHIRADCPETEWGYGWEHFMFRNVMNPQDRSGSGTNLLMRKAWVCQKTIDQAGGKEYCDVPMSYIAQWFRKETWCMVARHGPSAIPPPTTHFKIQASTRHGAWIVSSDNPEVKQDLIHLYTRWKQRTHNPRTMSSKGPTRPPSSQTPSFRILWRIQGTDELQKTNMSIPVRMPKRIQHCLVQDHAKPHLLSGTCVPAQRRTDVTAQKNMIAVYRASSPSIVGTSRNTCKRRADSQDENDRPSKVTKR